jgi:hypothetical protein
MHERQAVVARYFNRVLGQTIKRRATRREPDTTFGNVVTAKLPTRQFYWRVQACELRSAASGLPASDQ